MQKINFIAYLYIEILQMYCIPFHFGTLGITSYALQIWPYQLAENFDVYMYKNSTSSHTSFLRCCHDFANLLFRVFWVSLNKPITFNKINLWEMLMFICMQKINFVPPFFLQTLQRYWKLVILATLAMNDYGWYQLVENFEAYCRPKK